MNSQKLAQEPLNWLTFPVLHSCKSEKVRHGHVHYALMNIPRTKPSIREFETLYDQDNDGFGGFSRY